MNCPHCPGTELVMSDRQGIEIDYCPKCRGVWLDRGELDKIIERSTQFEASYRRDDDDDDDDDDDRRRRHAPHQYPQQPGYQQQPHPPQQQQPYYKKRKSFWSELFD